MIYFIYCFRSRWRRAAENKGYFWRGKEGEEYEVLPSDYFHSIRHQILPLYISHTNKVQRTLLRLQKIKHSMSIPPTQQLFFDFCGPVSGLFKASSHNSNLPCCQSLRRCLKFRAHGEWADLLNTYRGLSRKRVRWGVRLPSCYQSCTCSLSNRSSGFNIKYVHLKGEEGGRKNYFAL